MPEGPEVAAKTALYRREAAWASPTLDQILSTLITVLRTKDLMPVQLRQGILAECLLTSIAGELQESAHTL